MAETKFDVELKPLDVKVSEPKKVKIVLDKPHIDAGLSYEAGDELETDSFTARWLVENKVGKLK